MIDRVVAAPATVVIVGAVPVRELASVPTTVAVAPAVALGVYETVATPRAFVVDVGLAKLPVPPPDHVTTCPAVPTEIPLASAS